MEWTGFPPEEKPFQCFSYVFSVFRRWMHFVPWPNLGVRSWGRPQAGLSQLTCWSRNTDLYYDFNKSIEINPPEDALKIAPLSSVKVQSASNAWRPKKHSWNIGTAFPQGESPFIPSSRSQLVTCKLYILPYTTHMAANKPRNIFINMLSTS